MSQSDGAAACFLDDHASDLCYWSNRQLRLLQRCHSSLSAVRLQAFVLRRKRKTISTYGTTSCQSRFVDRQSVLNIVEHSQLFRYTLVPNEQ